MTSPSRGLPRNPRLTYRFQNRAFEFFFQWILGAQTHGGVELGECFYAASEIQDGSPESWYTAWAKLAQRVEKRAQTSFSNGHVVSAREAYQRAYVYYRAAPAFLSPRKDSRYQELWHKAQACFRQAAALFDPPIQPVAIPFENSHLPGYFLQPEVGGATRPTLIMVGGADTFAEDLYFYIGPAALKRGYNLLLVDLPGQGGLPFEGLVMRADSEIPMTAVVDYVLAQPTVDGDRLAAYGISAGGYLVPRAVTREKRIKACVACSIILDFSQILPSNITTLDHSLRFRLIKALLPHKLQAVLALFETYMWRWDAATLTELYSIAQRFTLDPSLITCPILNLVAEQEYTHFDAGRLWVHRCLETVRNPHTQLIITPQNEGADSHSVGTNLSLMSQLVFDWLDEVLQPHAQMDLTASPMPV